ncbi:MAG TPA: Hpt domain-containing protein, partial [Kofleriaceae bacterium]
MSQIDAATLAALQVTFLEESFEGLDRAETGLLQLADDPDPEVIGELFRVIHSIKGGAGAFGVTEVTELAHVMENLLDDLRSGTLPTAEGCAALLAGVDELRATLREPAEARVLRAATHHEICEKIVACRAAGKAAPKAPVSVELVAPPAVA